MGRLKKFKAVRNAKNVRHKHRVLTPMQIKVRMVSALLERERQEQEARVAPKQTHPAKEVPFTDWVVCPSCHALYPRLTRHHIRPASCGGRTSAANIAMLCRGCHDAVHNILNRLPLEQLKKQPMEFFRGSMDDVLQQHRVRMFST